MSVHESPAKESTHFFPEASEDKNDASDFEQMWKDRAVEAMDHEPHRRMHAWRHTPLKYWQNIPPRFDLPKAKKISGVTELSDEHFYALPFAMREWVSAPPSDAFEARLRLNTHTFEYREYASSDSSGFQDHTFSAEQGPKLVLLHVRSGVRAKVRHLFKDASGSMGLFLWVYLEEGAILEDLSFFEASEGMIQPYLWVYQEARSEYRVLNVRQGAHAHLSTSAIRLVGPESKVFFYDAAIGTAQSHVECRLNVTHEADRTYSDIQRRGIAFDRSRSVMRVHTEVAPGLHRIEAYQMLKHLLMSRTAEVDALPELSIHTDDIQCRHGATLGALDEAALLYLRSRGLKREQAEQLLAEAFIHEIMIQFFGREDLIDPFLSSYLQKIFEGESHAELS